MKAHWLLVVGLTFGSVSLVHAESPSANQSQDLDTLFDAFSKSPGLYAKFREQKQIALLLAPLKSEGTLHFDRKHGLARHTRTPSPSSVLLTASSLSFWDGKKSESVALSSAPGLKAFVDGFRMILGADRAGIERNFEMAFSGDPNGKWKLDLVPRDASLKKAVSRIELTGEKLVFSSLVVKEANGDVTTTEFYAVDTAKKYSEAEAKDLFRVPPKLP